MTPFTRPRIGPAVCVCAAMLAGATVLPGLSDRSLSYDEGVSAALATARWPSFVDTVVHAEPNMAFYYLLLRLPGAHGSVGELRALSAAAFIGAVVLVAVLGRVLLGWRVGAVAAALLATNAEAVGSGQGARSYALLLFLTVLSTLLLSRAAVNPGPGSSLFVAWGLVSGLTAYVHLLGLVTTAGQAAAFAVCWPRRRRSLVLGMVPASVLWVPLLVVAWRRGSSGISWIAAPQIDDVEPLAATVSGGAVPLAVVVAALVWATCSGAARHSAVRFLLVLTVLPFVGVLVLSVLGTSLWLPRYLVAGTAPAALLVGTAVSASRRSAVVSLLAAVAVAASIVGLLHRPSGPAEDYRAAATVVGRSVHEGDVTAFVDPTAEAAFAIEAGSAAPPVLFPAVAPGASLFDGRRGLAGVEREMPDALLALLHYSRVWLVESHLGTPWAADLRAQMVDALRSAGFQSMRPVRFTGVDVVLFTRAG